MKRRIYLILGILFLCVAFYGAICGNQFSLVVSIFSSIASIICYFKWTKPKPYWDDPQWDGTNAVHPAWWRGEKWSAFKAAELIADVLSGKDIDKGVMSEPLETMRNSVFNLKQDRDRLKKKTENCFILLNKYNPDITGGSNLDWQVESLLKKCGELELEIRTMKHYWRDLLDITKEKNSLKKERDNLKRISDSSFQTIDMLGASLQKLTIERDNALEQRQTDWDTIRKYEKILKF